MIQPQSDTAIALDLLEQEQTRDMLDCEATSTVTLYDGRPPVEYIRKKCNEIVKVNPWLKGKLVKKQGTIKLHYSDDSDHVESCGFAVAEKVQLDACDDDDVRTSVSLYSKALSQYCVKKGNACINKSEPLFRVVVGEVTPNRFFLLMSLSHVIGDGFTFYKLYHMLSMNVAPQDLQVERDVAKGAEVNSKSANVNAAFRSAGIMCNMIGKFVFGKKLKFDVREIITERIQEAKDDYKANLEREEQQLVDAVGDKPPPCNGDMSGGSVPVVPAVEAASFISTNDILTSSYLRAADCDLGLMAINYRNRIEGLTDRMAGNYETAIPYQRGDYETSSLIRHSVKTGAPLHAARPLLQGFLAKRRAKLALVTNWSGFYQQICLPNAVHIAHFPAYTTLWDPYVLNVAIIFMLAENKPALLSIEHPDRPVLSEMPEVRR